MPVLRRFKDVDGALGEPVQDRNRTHVCLSVPLELESPRGFFIPVDPGRLLAEVVGLRHSRPLFAGSRGLDNWDNARAIQKGHLQHPGNPIQGLALARTSATQLTGTPTRTTPPEGGKKGA
jgi:hypothetical protein